MNYKGDESIVVSWSKFQQVLRNRFSTIINNDDSYTHIIDSSDNTNDGIKRNNASKNKIINRDSILSCNKSTRKAIPVDAIPVSEEEEKKKKNCFHMIIHP